MTTVQISDRFNDTTYLENNPTWHAEDAPWKARQILKIINQNKVVASEVCEVGCGSGEILVQLETLGLSAQFQGFELSADAYAICEKRKSKTVNFALEDITKSAKTWDVLLCIDVFEHVENYIEFVRNLRPKSKNHIFHIPLDLSVSGIVRNRMIEVRKSVGHLHYFTAETALSTLHDAGYEIVDHFFTAPFEPGGIKPNSRMARVLQVPRRIAYWLSPKWLARTIGGCSLMVLARPKDS